MCKYFLTFICIIIFVAESDAKPSHKIVEPEPLLEQEVTSGLKEHKRIPRQDPMGEFFMKDMWAHLHYPCRNCRINNIGNGIGNHNEVYINYRH